MPVDKILRGLKRFQKKVYPKHRELFRKLALQQRPTALFITCADSRIDPCLLTQTKPGELFICRVIGNIVPRYPESIGGVSATIEYAVGVLGVPDVIVCGHTDCGVMKGVLNPEALKPLANVSAWLEPCATRARGPCGIRRHFERPGISVGADRAECGRTAQESTYAPSRCGAAGAGEPETSRLGVSHREGDCDHLQFATGEIHLECARSSHGNLSGAMVAKRGSAQRVEDHLDAFSRRAVISRE